MSSYSYSMQEATTSPQYFHTSKQYAQATSDYSTLGTYNRVSGQFVTGPPILSETKVQIIPSYGGVGFSSPASMRPGTNYFVLNDAYCCGQSTCQSVTQPIYGNVVKNVYSKEVIPSMQVPLKYSNF